MSQYAFKLPVAGSFQPAGTGRMISTSRSSSWSLRSTRAGEGRPLVRTWTAKRVVLVDKIADW